MNIYALYTEGPLYAPVLIDVVEIICPDRASGFFICRTKGNKFISVNALNLKLQWAEPNYESIRDTTIRNFIKDLCSSGAYNTSTGFTNSMDKILHVCEGTSETKIGDNQDLEHTSKIKSDVSK